MESKKADEGQVKDLRQILSKDLDWTSYAIKDEIQTYRDLSTNLKDEEIKAIEIGLKNLQKEKEYYRSVPQVQIDFETKQIQMLSWPLFKEMNNIGSDILTPTGLSIGLISADQQIISFQRSKENEFCPGFLGTPARYMRISKKELAREITLSDLVDFNVRATLENEIGLKNDDYDFTTYCLCNVSYPYNQKELIVLAQSQLSADEIGKKAKHNNDLYYVNEKNILILNKKKIDKLFLEKKVPVAQQHAIALQLAAQVAELTIIKQEKTKSVFDIQNPQA